MSNTKVNTLHKVIITLFLVFLFSSSFRLFLAEIMIWHIANIIDTIISGIDKIKIPENTNIRDGIIDNNKPFTIPNLFHNNINNTMYEISNDVFYDHIK